MEEPTMSTNDYINVREIGKGAFGTAHIVQHKVTGAVYVLKRVRLARQTARERTSSVRELHLLANLKHRNVLKFYGCWIEGGCNLCTLLELCEAGDLAAQIRYRQPGSVHFSEEALQDMAVQLLSALAYLHGSRIAHRDLKTANILVTGEGCLKIADFGLSTVLEPDPRAGGQLLTRTVVGTPHYMSPCVLQEKPYGTPNDVWALGCVLYELSALKPAFSAFNMAGLIRKVTTGAAPPLPSCYSESWRALVRSCLAKEPSLRPTAEELLQSECLQAAVLRVGDNFGPPLPEGAPEALERLEDLPPSIMGLFGTFAAQERDEKRRADEARERRRVAAAKWDPMARAAAMAAEQAKATKLPPLKPHVARKPPPARKAAPPPLRSAVPPLVPRLGHGAVGAGGGGGGGAIGARRRTHNGDAVAGTGTGAGGDGRLPRAPAPHPNAPAALHAEDSEAALRSVAAETSDLRITASRASHRPSSAPPDSPARRSRRGRRDRTGGGGSDEEDGDHGFGPPPGPSSDGDGDCGGGARRRHDRMVDRLYTSSGDEGEGRAEGGAGMPRSGRSSRLGPAGGSGSLALRARDGSSGSAWGPPSQQDVTEPSGSGDAGALAADPGSPQRDQHRQQRGTERRESGGSDGSPRSPARQSAPVAPATHQQGPHHRPPLLPRPRTNPLEAAAGGPGGGAAGRGSGTGALKEGAGGGGGAETPRRRSSSQNGGGVRAAAPGPHTRPPPRPTSSSNNLSSGGVGTRGIAAGASRPGSATAKSDKSRSVPGEQVQASAAGAAGRPQSGSSLRRSVQSTGTRASSR